MNEPEIFGIGQDSIRLKMEIKGDTIRLDAEFSIKETEYSVTIPKEIKQ